MRFELTSPICTSEKVKMEMKVGKRNSETSPIYVTNRPIVSSPCEW